MPSYYGVESTNAFGTTSSGYLVANGNVYPAVSGAGKYTDIPAGSYTHNDGETPREDQPTMTDGTGRQKFLKFLVVGSAADGKIHEKRAYWEHRKDGWHYHPNGGDRDGIELHYDGGNPGTAGCIGYQDPAAKADIVADTDKSVNVQYLADEDAVKRAVELRLGKPVDWTKVNAPRKPGSGAASGAGEQSQTKKGKKVDKGHTKVLVGPKQRFIGHKQAALIGGGQVAEGNDTVRVGTEQYAVARVEHMTTDGSPVADGETTVLLT